jgi:ABC-2 type transport system permease protein
MQDNLRLYVRYLGISLRSQMQYRASFLMSMVGHLFTTLIEFLGITVLFQRFGNLRGWTLPEIALFYGIVNIAFALAEGVGRGFDVFPDMIKSGSFDRLLLRPRSTALQVAGQELQLMRVGRLLQGVGVLVWASAALKVTWTAGSLLFLCAIVLGGTCMFYGLFVLQATLAFWTIETLEIMNAVTYGGIETAQYPLTIYRPWFRRFFTFVIPLACMNYLPVGALLGRSTSSWEALLAGLSPLVGVCFLLVCLQIWKLGVRHYHSTGS